MRRVAVFIFAVFVSFHAALAHAERSTSAAAPAAQSPIPLRGTLYRIDYRGRSSYLFGTVHVGQAAFYPLEPQVTRALQQSEQLALEVDIRNTAAFQQAILRYGVYPDEQTVAQHLPVDELAQLQQALEHAGIPFANVARMKPWMIANVLLVQTMARHGFPAEQGLEQYFLGVAAQQKKPVVELESAGYQLSLFDQLDEQQQQVYLRETMQDIADGSAIDKGIALIDAWSRADSTAMQAAVDDMLNDDSVSSRFIERTLLAQRNPHMAERIAAWLKSGKTTFVAVGTLHLIGKDSIPALLRQRGYRVSRLY
ncbi:MAG TPA: TraB/GumN family protein [Oxalicibacterium sp.]|nr:TraB/GumN family protein [Oxalicibacterium sp.]